MSKWFDIYARLPIVLQNACCTLAGLKMRRTRHNRLFRDTLALLEQSQWWSAAELAAYQNELLQRTIRHAYDTVPYYREIFDARRLKPDDIRTAEDLPKLPILDKQTVRNRSADLCSRGWPSSRIVTAMTGGTTGTALRLQVDRDNIPRQWAIWWRHRRRFGCDLNDPFIVFAGRSVVPLSRMDPPIWRRNLIMHQTYVSIHHMTKQNLGPLVDYLQKRKVAYYSGYPSALYLLAKYLLEKQVRLAHPPRMAFTGAETLLPHQRRALREAFGCDVADQYGATEGCVGISECEHHRYHLDAEFAVTEFVPLKDMPPNVRRIVGTTLHNPAMPLIRYDIGDIATLAGEPCACGRAAATVEKIDGRIESYIITPDGRQLGRLDFLFKKSAAIDEAQLIQDALDHVTVKLVPNNRYTADDEAHLLADMRGYLGEVIRIDIEHVTQIPREANGKFRQIVSTVVPDLHQEALPAARTGA